MSTDPLICPKCLGPKAHDDIVCVSCQRADQEPDDIDDGGQGDAGDEQREWNGAD